MRADRFEAFLASLQRQDGVLWTRILGQTHWQYDEVPFWVLVADSAQIAPALSFLQDALRPLRDALRGEGADVTVAFVGLTPTRHLSYGMFEGEAFFAPTALKDLYGTPYEGVREQTVFDVAYPHDPYAVPASGEAGARGA